MSLFATRAHFNDHNMHTLLPACARARRNRHSASINSDVYGLRWHENIMGSSVKMKSAGVYLKLAAIMTTVAVLAKSWRK